MGYNTVMMVCNDGAHMLSKEPTAGAAIHEAIQHSWGKGDEPVDARIRNCSVRVLSSEHADMYQLVLVGGNTIHRVSTFYRGFDFWRAHDPKQEAAEQVLKELAEQLGYTLRKTKARLARETAIPTEAADPVE